VNVIGVLVGIPDRIHTSNPRADKLKAEFGRRIHKKPAVA
jgi:hypothetical protein